MLLRRAATTMAARSLSTTANQGVVQFKQILQQQLKDIEAAGTFKRERVITSPQDAVITVRGSNREVLNFCANNYLGLSDDKDVIAAAQKALVTHGNGLSSVRFICGTQDLHKELESKVAQFHQMEDAILYISCFDANGGIFELFDKEDAIISDSLNHASIIDGIRLSKAKRYRYEHLDLKDLEQKLKDADKEGARVKVIATDGVFSMDGEIAPLDRICDLADKYNAITFVDECHATGFLGATGRGTDEYHNVRGRVTIINSTLGKALGGAAGGYTASSAEIVGLLRQKARPYLFSNSIPPAIVASAIHVFDRLSASTKLRDQLAENTRHFRKRMTEAGFVMKGKDHPIVPIMLGDARLASEFADDMLARGIYVVGFSYPVVPKGQARIRVQLSAAHTKEQIDKAVDAFIEIGRARKVIPTASL